MTLPPRRARRLGEPIIYSCGCSWLKVSLGKCDAYDSDGAPRGTPPESSNARTRRASERGKR